MDARRLPPQLQHRPHGQVFLLVQPERRCNHDFSRRSAHRPLVLHRPVHVDRYSIEHGFLGPPLEVPHGPNRTIDLLNSHFFQAGRRGLAGQRPPPHAIRNRLTDGSVINPLLNARPLPTGSVPVPRSRRRG
ncbi:hypothetical protein SBA3_2470011 [Candidatus Sulfopaludibacter sp. SbA3]|nr:hypothetical protein SBA3_2470011 [Candidatus Sulfopaludibacter sp. SbA3]